MHINEDTSNEQLAEIIIQFFGFLPPLFIPAQQTPHVLHNLFQQTISAYIYNPIPILFREQLFAYLSRYCSVRYSIVCHCCVLRSLGMAAHEVLTLLETPPLTDLEIEPHLQILAAMASSSSHWPESGSPTERSLFLCAVFLSLLPERAAHVRNSVRLFLSDAYYNALIEFLSYVKTCHFWVETHPELSLETDKRVQHHLDALLTDEPKLAIFFSIYNEKARVENEHIVRDHIARKHIEDRLRTSESQTLVQTQQLEATFEAMTDGVVVYDSQGNMLRVNAAYRKMIALHIRPEHTQLSPDERGNMLDLRDETGQPLALDQRPVTRMLRGEVMTGDNMMDIIVHALDSSTIQLNVSGTPMRDHEGKVVGGVIIFRDVTQRRRLERRTYEALEGLIALAETIHSFDRSFALVAQHNHSAGERLVRLTRSILDCQRASILVIEPETEIIHPVAVNGLSPQLEQLWWSSMEGAKLINIISETPLLARLRAGEEFIVDTAKPPYNSYPNPFAIATALVAPLRIDHQLVGILSFDFCDTPHEYTQDEITLTRAIAKLTTLVIERERLLYERTAAQASELALLEANRRMDEFMGIASHELKTPLTTIKGYVQLVARRLKNSSRTDAAQSNNGHKQSLESAGELLERTNGQIERLGRLVNELLDVSRIRANKLELHLERCDLAALIRDTVQDQLLELEAVQRTVHLDIATEESVPIIADADRIGQVIANYLSNALKYSTEHQPVNISLRIEGQSTQVLVQDKGLGLSPADQQHIWERFYRVQGIEVQTGSGIGLGLGLYICRTIIEQHNGQVGVESTSGQGSTFWFSLPLASIPS